MAYGSGQNESIQWQKCFLGANIPTKAPFLKLVYKLSVYEALKLCLNVICLHVIRRVYDFCPWSK